MRRAERTFAAFVAAVALVLSLSVSLRPAEAASSYLVDNVKMSVSGTPGTGTITLGSAVAGSQSASTAGVPNGSQVSYYISDGGTNWEIGQGTYSSSGTTLTRGAIWSSSGAGTAISLDSSALVSLTVLAEDFANYLSLGGTQTVSGAKTFSNVFTVTSGINLTIRTASGATDTVSNADYIVAANNCSAAATETLPASPTQGEAHIIKDGCGAATHNVTVAGNGHNIDGASTFVINWNGGSVGVVFDSSANIWRGL